MTQIGILISTFLAAAAVTVGGVLGGDSSGTGSREALVVDAGAARDGRELIAPELRGVDAELRLPRTAAEALTNVRYFAAQGYRLVVTGPHSSAAARSAGVMAVRAPDVGSALRAVR
jgi:hypothetical protein